MGLLDVFFGRREPEPTPEISLDEISLILEALGLRYDNFVRAKHEDLPRLVEAQRVLEVNNRRIAHARQNSQADWQERRLAPSLEASVAECRAQVAATIFGRENALVWHGWLRRLDGGDGLTVPGAAGEEA